MGVGRSTGSNTTAVTGTAYRKPVLGLPTAGLAAVRFKNTDVNVPIDVTDHCDNGIVSGDPALASAEAGRAFADHIVATTVALVEHLKTVEPRSQGRTP